MALTAVTVAEAVVFWVDEDEAVDSDGLVCAGWAGDWAGAEFDDELDSGMGVQLVKTRKAIAPINEELFEGKT